MSLLVDETVQVASDSVTTLVSHAGDIGAVGILAIIAVFVYRFLPRMVERAMDEHRRSVEQFAVQLRLERELFERQIAAERDACREQFELLLESSKDHRDAVLSALERLERSR